MASVWILGNFLRILGPQADPEEEISESERICSSVKIQKASLPKRPDVKIPDSQKIQNMTRFLSNATKSGFAAHHLLVFEIYFLSSSFGFETQGVFFTGTPLKSSKYKKLI